MRPHGRTTGRRRQRGDPTGQRYLRVRATAWPAPAHKEPATDPVPADALADLARESAALAAGLLR